MKNVYFLFLIFILTLSSCGRQEAFSDLQHDINQMKGTVEKTPLITNANTIKKAPVVIYQVPAGRVPFESKVKASNKMFPSHPLIVPLNLLRFVGTLLKNGQIWAYIQTQDNKIYQVTIGDTLGDHDAKIVSITSTRVVLSEQVFIENEKTIQKMVVLQLKEEGK